MIPCLRTLQATKGRSLLGLSRATSLTSSRALVSAQSFHTSGPKNNLSDLTASATGLLQKYKDATDHGKYHLINVGLAAATPVAFALSPTVLAVPIDLAFGVAIPFHMQVGLTGVIQDYVPRSLQQYSIWALYAASGLTAYGLLKVNLCGPGITESVKTLWRAPAKEDQ